MDRRWVCLATLGPIGVASLVYVVIVARVHRPESTPTTSSAGRCSACCRMFVFGMWLLTVSSSRTALYHRPRGDRDGSRLRVRDIRAGGTSRCCRSRGSRSFNMLGLTADAVATRGCSSPCSRPSPTGVPERRWQRIAVVFIWTPVLVGPLDPAHDPVRRDVAVHRHQRRRPSRTRTPCRGSSGPPPPCTTSSYQPWPAVVLGARACSATGRCSATRRCARAPASWPPRSARRWSRSRLWTFLPERLGLRVLVYRVADRDPVAGDPRHPPLRRIRHRARRPRRAVSPVRRTCSSRCSTGSRVATPAVLLGDSLTLVGAALLTTLVGASCCCRCAAGRSGASIASSSATGSSSSPCWASSARGSSRR